MLVPKRKWYCPEERYKYFEDYFKSYRIERCSGYKNAEVYVQSLPSKIQLSENTWILNTEQASRPDITEIIGIDPEAFVHLCDYSEENIEILKRVYAKAKFYHLPYLPNPDEIYILKKSEWFAMIGAHSERRDTIFRKLWNVNWIEGWGKDRDIQLFKHKVLINIHYDEKYRITEQLRIMRCIRNKMVVISEPSDHMHVLSPWLRERILFCEYEDIPKVAIEVMTNYLKYRTLL